MQDPKAAQSKVTGLLKSIICSARLNLTFQSDVEELPTPSVRVTFDGPDTPLLTDHNGELLHALEHIAAKILHLEPHDHDRINFEAASFKANRDHAMQTAARAAIKSVRETHQTFSFPAMNSRERRILHLILNHSGLMAASTGEGAARHIVLHPNLKAAPATLATVAQTTIAGRR